MVNSNYTFFKFFFNNYKFFFVFFSYTDEKNSLYYSIAYTMQDPILALNKKMGAVADKNGNQIYIFDQNQQKGQVTTLLPIKHVAVSDQGIVAVLMEENNSAKPYCIYLC